MMTQALFEVVLCDLSGWTIQETVLNKRQAFRSLYGYQIQDVADMTDEELEALMDNPAIIRKSS